MLIIDDQAEMRVALRAFLQRVYPGAEISEAASGIAALGLCAQREFSVVLVDISLPDINGLELIAPIRALLPRCAIIVVSQHDAASYRERALVAGAFTYVRKDTIFRELKPAIDNALHARKVR